MHTITLDMYQTLAVAVAALFLGTFIKKKATVLKRLCIPSPVIGGGIVSILVCIFYSTGVVEVCFTETIKDIAMLLFFTAVGFQVQINTLRSYGVLFVRILLVVALIAVSQNVIALVICRLLGVDSYAALCMGSVSMLGGHGTSAAFGPVIENLGLTGATTLATAAATFGLVAGSLIGGPTGAALIKKFKLEQSAQDEDAPAEEKPNRIYMRTPYYYAACQLGIAAGLGSLLSSLISKTGLVFPGYVGAMITGLIISNLGTMTGWYKVPQKQLNDISTIMLDFFLGIALVALKLWQIAGLALSLIVVLFVQTLFMVVFARFVVFRILGKNYDAAVITSGVCGFGLGATPNALANMRAVTSGRATSVKAFLLVPVIGGVFLDLINSFTILFFINKVL